MRLEDFVLYLDENLDNCKPIVEALAERKVKFERHRDHYARGTLDAVWLSFVGRNGWIVLTKDKRNRYNQWEREAVTAHAVREFYFGSGNVTGAEMAEALVTALPAMIKIFHREDPPIIASISRAGTVTVIFDKHGSTHERRGIERRGRKHKGS